VLNKVPNRSWEIISTDLITQLLKSNSYNAICVIVDRLTKRADFVREPNSVPELSQLLFVQHLTKRTR